MELLFTRYRFHLFGRCTRGSCRCSVLSRCVPVSPHCVFQIVSLADGWLTFFSRAMDCNTFSPGDVSAPIFDADANYRIRSFFSPWLLTNFLASFRFFLLRAFSGQASLIFSDFPSSTSKKKGGKRARGFEQLPFQTQPSVACRRRWVPFAASHRAGDGYYLRSF